MKFIKLPNFLSPLGFVQILLYTVSIILGLIVVIPLGVTFENFHHVCPLWGQIVWHHRTIWPWMEETCNFTLYWGIAGSIVYPIFMLIALFMAVCPHTTRFDDTVGIVQSRHATYMLKGMTPVFAFINIIVLTLHLCSAILITSGLIFFCTSILKNYEDMGTPLGSCAAAQWVIDWGKIRIIGGDSWGVWGSNFYTCYAIACFAQWLLVILWLLVLILSCVTCCPSCKFGLPEEKQKTDTTFNVALRRSRLQTPIGTPGAGMTPSVSTQQFFPPPQQEKERPPPEVLQMMQQMKRVDVPSKV